MTDTNDPFAHPPPPGSVPPAGAVPPPGPPPPAAGATPPPVGGAQTWRPESASGLAKAVLAVSAGVVLVQMISALLATDYVEFLKRRDPNELDMHPAALVEVLFAPLMLTVFILFGLWVRRIRAFWRYRNVEPGGPPHVEWWGWFVPFAALVLPYLGVRAINRKVAPAGAVGWWWGLFVVHSVVMFSNAMSQLQAIDLQTGRVVRPEAFDTMVTTTVIGAFALAVSWIFMVVWMRAISKYHDQQP